MKNLLIVIIFFLVLLSCTDLICNQKNNENNPEITDLARVIIPLPVPTVSNSRTVTLEEAKTYTNFFEVSFENLITNSIYSANASIEKEFIEATIPPGSYNILLFAGDKCYYSNYDPLLLASSYAENVTILLEELNTVDLLLTIFEFTFTAPKKVILDEDYIISIYIDTKNPLINNFSSGGLASDIYNSGGDLDITINDEDYIKDGNIYTFSSNFIAPSIVSSKVYNFHGYIKIGISTWSYGTTAHPYFEQNFSKTINFVEGADVKINISWSE